MTYDSMRYDHIIFVFDFRKHVVISLSTLVTNSHLVTIDIGLAFLGSIIVTSAQLGDKFIKYVILY